MPTNHQVVAALPISTSASQTLLRNMLVQRTAYVVDSAAAAADLVAVDPTTGVVIIVIICLGRTYLYDSADTTTAHDGVSCLVTDDDKRYKLATNAEVLCYSVLERTNTPPGSPAIGDAYLTASSPTGAWSGNANKIEVYTARGWEVITPAIGRLIYVEDVDAYYRKKADGSVSIGFGANAVTAASLPVSVMDGGAGIFRHIVENQTTNTPPAVTDGVGYIIGSSPTGDWVGHAGKIARGQASAWVIYTPAEGWTAYDKSTDTDYLYTGSAWITASGDVIMTLRYYTASATWTKPDRLVYVEVEVAGGGANATTGAAGTSGSTSSFGAHCSATGGGSATAGTNSAGGSGTGGDINLSGGAGTAIMGATCVVIGGSGAGTLSAQGRGGNALLAGGDGTPGGGGGAALKKILTASLGSTEAVTVGSAGRNNGYVLVKEYTRA